MYPNSLITLSNTVQYGTGTCQKDKAANFKIAITSFILTSVLNSQSFIKFAKGSMTLEQLSANAYTAVVCSKFFIGNIRRKK